MAVAGELLNWELRGSRRRAASSPFTGGLARKLVLERALHGHQGCVNRLAFSADGTLLASGSDDCTVALWPYPGGGGGGGAPFALRTEHRANIFGVDFLRGSNNSRLVSGAMDETVQLHVLDTLPSSPAAASGGNSTNGGEQQRGRRHGAQALRSVQPHTTTYRCHRGRVKDVRGAPDSPHVFWSAAEDGFVREFDARSSAAGQRSSFRDANALVALTARGSMVELKGLDACAARPHLLALACDDAYVRVYDRRTLSCRSPDAAASAAAVPLLALAPPHLPLVMQAGGGGGGRSHSTCVKFSARGDKLLANYHSDHAYAFDVTSAGALDAVHVQPLLLRPRGNGAASSSSAAAAAAPAAAAAHDAQPPPPALPEAAVRLWRQARASLSSGADPTAAVDALTAAVALAPWSPPLRVALARALLKRDWRCDAALALACCDTAITLCEQGYGAAAATSSSNAADADADAYHLRVSAMHRLHQDESALRAMDDLRQRFPRKWGERQEQLRATLVARLDATRAQRKRRAEQRLGRRRKLRAAVRAAATAAAAAAPPGTSAVAAAQAAATAAAVRNLGDRSDDEDEDDDDDDDDDDDAAAAAAALLASDEQNAEAEDEEEEQEWREQLLHIYYGDDGDSSSSSGGDDDDDRPDGRADAAGPSGRRNGGGGGFDARRGARGGLWGATPGARRLLGRYVGHCNVQTDIKEAVFLGDDLVAAGSDDGRVYIYVASGDDSSGRNGGSSICGGGVDGGVDAAARVRLPVAALDADEDVANCVQPHPTEALLATSGIERTVKLWAPTGPSRVVDPGLARANQERMRAGPQLLRFNPWSLAAAFEGNPQLLQMLTAMQMQAQQQQQAQQQEQQGGGLSDGDGDDEGDDDGSDDDGSGDDDDEGGGGGGGRPE